MTFRCPKEVVISTWASWRGQSIGACAGGVSVRLPALWQDNHHFDGKAVIISLCFVYDTSFFCPGTGKLPEGFRKLGICEVSMSQCRNNTRVNVLLHRCCVTLWALASTIEDNAVQYHSVAGRLSFMLLWFFDVCKQPYISCWPVEAKVLSNTMYVLYLLELGVGLVPE